MARKLDSSIRSIISQVHSTTDSNELLGAILAEFGGPVELAREIKRSYDESQGMAKQRYMEMFQRLVVHVTKEDITGKVDPSEMSDVELFQAAKSVIRWMKEAGEDIEIDDKPAEAAPPEQLVVEEDFGEEPIDMPIPHESAAIELPESETRTLSKRPRRKPKSVEQRRGKGKPDLTWLVKSYDDSHFFD